MSRIFISDLHLDASEPRATRQFLQLLREQAASAEALYILGDLFEAWVGDDDPEPYKASVCAALRELAASEVPCFVIHGNRDFLLGSGFSARTGAALLPDPVIAELDGEPILLTHGDLLCTEDHSYQELRAIVRTPGWQRRFLGLPFEVRDALANQARKGSRAHTSSTDAYIMDVNPAAVEAAFRSTGVSRIVHGHTHRPGVHDLIVDGRPVQRIVLGAWHDGGNYLSYERGHFELRQLPAE